MRSAALLLLFPLLAQDAAWWNADWTHRRRLAVTNVLEGPLPAGFPVAVDLDPALLREARADLSDLAVIGDGKRVPSFVAASPVKGRLRLWFRLATEVPKKGRDARYELYYGNPAATPESGPAGVFEAADDFEREGPDPALWSVEGGLKVRVERGKLVVQEIPVEATERRPAKLVLKKAAPDGGFLFSADLELAAEARGGYSAGLSVSMAAEGAEDVETQKKIADLIGRLADEDLSDRERALEALIASGRAAIRPLKAALESADPEVRKSAEQALTAIESAHAPPVIETAVRQGDGTPSSNTGLVRIGSKVSSRGAAFARPGTAKLAIAREASGAASVLWNGTTAGTGSVPGRVQEVAITLWRSGDWVPGSVSIDNVVLRRHLDDFWMPTITLDASEQRK